MEVQKKLITLSGTHNEVVRQERKLRYEFKHVHELNAFTKPLSNGEVYRSVTLECTPYSPEELDEIQAYGNPEHENYLLSDDYDYDCRNEGFDWLKNETT